MLNNTSMARSGGSVIISNSFKPSKPAAPGIKKISGRALLVEEFEALKKRSPDQEKLHFAMLKLKALDRLAQRLEQDPEAVTKVDVLKGRSARFLNATINNTAWYLTRFFPRQLELTDLKVYQPIKMLFDRIGSRSAAQQRVHSTKRVLEIAGRPVAVFEPKPGHKKNFACFTTNGGGYLVGGGGSHDNMHVQLAEAGITVYTIDYMGEVFKKGYKTTHPHAKNMVLEVYQGLVAEGHLDPKTTTWLGDSAAGHLNLVAMDALVNDPKYSGLESPAHMFLISPFSDPMVTGETALNPANGFVILGRRIRMCMDVLRGEKPMYDRDVTPLLNDFTGYPPMTIHYSKNEALASDALRVAVKNLQAGQKTDVYCLMNMHHVPHVFGPWLASSYQSTALMIEHLDGFYKE